ncbi:putative UDP-N-acetylglucosamine-1-phosphate transferase [Prochlorococcus marinus subsp. pastoris str. CCMP1986]|uniref:Putative UDP-N-acetylglucosamine-1-phosphate transferase n=1 Tax=Prochlorococcus marinus subsp. pastoris (strain CCMP1986 / NIES-2087 / MED4) TaxID=59919 RepID=Q7V0M9_PROMP|nr:MraY family glycosyltransferase [Prochlorococcus marinus]KGF87210.1 Undecaprenyl-phosphate N-acetylglucosaminyl 1-phosphate transferase [Prochlorococcus marinus str. EQPAC1]CAE19686.1 putative UDP-N-acetylglucosamine-1-phosphate transferase [Prochlorococcus marinus subsp. pastoris str. CCMP1986]
MLIEITCLLIIFIIAFLLTFILVPFSKKIGSKYGIFDSLNSRKVKKIKLVRIGGLAIFLGFFLSLLGFIFFQYISSFFIIEYRVLFVLVGLSLCFFLIGIYDDVLSLSPFKRLFLSFILACFAWNLGIDLNNIDISFLNLGFENIIFPNYLSLILTLIWLVGVTNAINWIDGLDGLASGCTGIMLSTFGIIAIQNNDYEYALISFALAGSSFAFLNFNFKPAKILMGDGGTYFIGFTLAFLSLLVSKNNQNILDFRVPLLTLFYPLVDMLRVIIVRFVKKKSLIYPDSNHLHHLLIRNNFSETSTVFILYGITICSSCLLLFIIF